MNWVVALLSANLIFVLSLIFPVVWPKLSKNIKSKFTFPIYKSLLFGTVLSALILFIPIYQKVYPSNSFLGLTILSLHHVIRTFVVDGELEFVFDNISDLPDIIFFGYFGLSSIIFLVAPMFTVGYILSLFKDVKSKLKYISYYTRKIYVFSELNSRSLALSTSISSKYPDSVMIFTGVNDEENEYIQYLNKIGRHIIFKKAINMVNYKIHSSNSSIVFFTINDEEQLNVDYSIDLIEKYKNRNNTELYIFSSLPESELIFSCVETDGMKIRRINYIQSFIYNELYNNGFETIFKTSIKNDNGNNISAVIIGSDRFCFELSKSLTWFCQMDGYNVTISTFSDDPTYNDRFTQKCPELLDEKHNNQLDDEGEPRYNLVFNEAMDYDSTAFYKSIASINDITYVFVSLGDDQKNVSVSVELRRLFERNHIHPEIRAVIFDSGIIENLNNISNFSGQKYDIDFIGDIKSLFSYDVIIDSKLEHEALQRHLKWGQESEFWKYNYNYRSSSASAIHKKMKSLCEIPGVDLLPEERKEADSVRIRKLEHRRWNAYMRSEGFVYSGSCEKSSRNNLAKTHNCLVPFDKLTIEEQIKDSD